MISPVWVLVIKTRTLSVLKLFSLREIVEGKRNMLKTSSVVDLVM